MHVSLRGAEPFLNDKGDERCSCSPTNYKLFRSDVTTNVRVSVTHYHWSCHALSSVLESNDPLHVRRWWWRLILWLTVFFAQSFCWELKRKLLYLVLWQEVLGFNAMLCSGSTAASGGDRFQSKPMRESWFSCVVWTASLKLGWFHSVMWWGKFFSFPSDKGCKCFGAVRISPPTTTIQIAPLKASLSAPNFEDDCLIRGPVHLLVAFKTLQICVSTFLKVCSGMTRLIIAKGTVRSRDTNNHRFTKLLHTTSRALFLYLPSANREKKGPTTCSKLDPYNVVNCFWSPVGGYTPTGDKKENKRETPKKEEAVPPLSFTLLFHYLIWLQIHVSEKNTTQEEETSSANLLWGSGGACFSLLHSLPPLDGAAFLCLLWGGAAVP